MEKEITNEITINGIKYGLLGIPYWKGVKIITSLSNFILPFMSMANYAKGLKTDEGMSESDIMDKALEVIADNFESEKIMSLMEELLSYATVNGDALTKNKADLHFMRRYSDSLLVIKEVIKYNAFFDKVGDLLEKKNQILSKFLKK